MKGGDERPPAELRGGGEISLGRFFEFDDDDGGVSGREPLPLLVVLERLLLGHQRLWSTCMVIIVMRGVMTYNESNLRISACEYEAPTTRLEFESRPEPAGCVTLLLIGEALSRDGGGLQKGEDDLALC